MSCDVGEVTERRYQSPSFPSLHLRHSWFSNPAVPLPTSQLILQAFRCFTYVTAHSPTLLSLLLRHRYFTLVTWRAAHASLSLCPLSLLLSLFLPSPLYLALSLSLSLLLSLDLSLLPLSISISPYSSLSLSLSLSLSPYSTLPLFLPPYSFLPILSPSQCVYIYIYRLISFEFPCLIIKWTAYENVSANINI